MWQIKLDATLPPEFPEICPICGRHCPDDRLVLSSFLFSTVAPPGLAHNWMWFWAEMPGCAGCAREIRATIYRRRIAYLATFVAGMIFLIDFFDGKLPKSWAAQRFWGGLIMLPWLAWELLHPLPAQLVLMEEEGNVAYRFANPEFAAEFAVLNDAEIELFKS